MQLICGQCKEVKASDNFTNREQRREGYRRCRACTAENNRRWQANNPRRVRSPEQLEKARERGRRHAASEEGKLKTADRFYRNRYGITVAEIDAMIEAQHNVCAVCRGQETRIDPRTMLPQRLQVDHNHANGRVRAMLCFRCNRVLGAVADDVELLEKMIFFVEKHSATPGGEQ